jgi:hypothetical protein
MDLRNGWINLIKKEFFKYYGNKNIKLPNESKIK